MEGRVEVFRNWATLIGGTLGGARGALCQRGAALPYSRDRGVNSAYLSVRHGVLAFSWTRCSGNDPFVRAEWTRL